MATNRTFNSENEKIQYESLKKSMITKFFIGRILRSVATKSMIYQKLHDEMLPFTDITHTEISETVDNVTISFGSLLSVDFEFVYEKRIGCNMFLKEIR